MAPPVHTQIQRTDIASADVKTRLTMFPTQLLGSWYGQQQPDLVTMGLQDVTSALVYKMPIAIGSPNWAPIYGGIKYRDLSKLLLPITFQEWSDGVREQVKRLQSDEWINFGWGMQPSEIAYAAALIPERLLAAALEAGENTASVENYLEGDTTSTSIKIFAQDKPVDPTGGNIVKYSNLFTSTGGADANFAAAPMSLANIDRVWSALRTIKSENGADYRDLTWTTTLVCPTDEMKARRYFENQGTANDSVTETSGTSTQQVSKPNTAKQYGITVKASPYLTRPGVWYPICTTRTNPKAPWVSITQIPANAVPLVGSFAPPPDGMSPIEAGFEFVLDYLDSHFYRHGIPGQCPPGYVAIGAKRTVGVGITCPWQIACCKPS